MKVKNKIKAIAKVYGREDGLENVKDKVVKVSALYALMDEFSDEIECAIDKGDNELLILVAVWEKLESGLTLKQRTNSLCIILAYYFTKYVMVEGAYVLEEDILTIAINDLYKKVVLSHVV